MELEGNGFTEGQTVHVAPSHLLTPTMVTVPSPTPVTTASTSSYKSLSTTTDKSSSDLCSVADVEIYKKENEVEELLADTQWPGAWMASQPDLTLDYESDQLHDILQSAKMILTGRYERPARTTSKGFVHHTKKSLSVSLPSTMDADDQCPPSPKVRQGKPKLRPKTAISTPALSKSKTKRNLSAVTQSRQPQQSAATLHKYKPPDISKVKREYKQLWNETGELKKKNTSYLEIHYDDCLPPEDFQDDNMRMKPTRYAYNHRHGHHWETRYLIEEEKPKRKLKKVERIFENELQMSKLDAMLDKKLKMRDS